MPILFQVALIANAVTPQSSPMPTPKHRKAEYKIEVFIPPNISDPLNLVTYADMDATEKSEAIACARRCWSSRLTRWWTRKE
jgi:hypothetical protein